MLPALDLLQPLSTTLAAGNPIEHVVDVKLVPLGSFGFWTMQLGTLLFAALVTILFLNTAANAIAGGSGAGNKKYVTRGRLGQFVEVVVLGLRDQMLLPILGEKHTRKYLPFLLSMFFFILTINLLGLVPVLDLQHLFGIKATWIGGTATATIAVNAAFATVVFFVIQIHSVRELGLKGIDGLDPRSIGLHLAIVGGAEQLLGEISEPEHGGPFLTVGPRRRRNA